MCPFIHTYIYYVVAIKLGAIDSFYMHDTGCNWISRLHNLCAAVLYQITNFIAQITDFMGIN